MAGSDDLDELARRYLDLWQDQMTALANDPEMAEAVERALRQWGMAAGWSGAGPGGPPPGPWGDGTMAAAGGPWAWPNAMMAALQAAMQAGMGAAASADQTHAPAGASQGTGDGGHGTAAGAGDGGAAAGTGGTAHGAAAAAGASAGGDLDLDQLQRRLAALEERLAALEDAEPAPGSGGNAGKPETRGRRHGS